MASDTTSSGTPLPGTSFSIRFTASGDDLRGTPPAGARDPLAGVRQMIDPALQQAMIEAEPQMLAWLRASRQNLIQFAMDPVGAMRVALPKLDPALLAKIATIRASAARVAPDLPGVTIDSFDVDVAPAATAQ
jgi:hypothetical protein